jgi:hypothetical protein
VTCIEAEEAQSKIEELKDEEYNERRIMQINMNEQEMDQMLQQREQHMNEFQANWDAHEKQLAESSERDLQELEENQGKRIMIEREQFDNKLPNSFRPSSQVLEFKNVFDKLVKQKKYAEAHTLREEFTRMEAHEKEAFAEAREKKINNHIAKILVFQQSERASLIKKCENQKAEQKRQRMIETQQ